MFDPEDYISESDNDQTEFDDPDSNASSDEEEKLDPSECELTVQYDRIAELDDDELQFI